MSVNGLSNSAPITIGGGSGNGNTYIINGDYASGGSTTPVAYPSGAGTGVDSFSLGAPAYLPVSTPVQQQSLAAPCPPPCPPSAKKVKHLQAKAAKKAKHAQKKALHAQKKALKAGCKPGAAVPGQVAGGQDVQGLIGKVINTLMGLTGQGGQPQPGNPCLPPPCPPPPCGVKGYPQLAPPSYGPGIQPVYAQPAYALPTAGNDNEKIHIRSDGAVDVNYTGDLELLDIDARGAVRVNGDLRPSPYVAA